MTANTDIRQLIANLPTDTAERHAIIRANLEKYYRLGAKNSASWYSEARSMADDLAEFYNLPVATVAAMFAVASSCRAWPVNKQIVLNFLHNWHNNKPFVPAKTTKQKRKHYTLRYVWNSGHFVAKRVKVDQMRINRVTGAWELDKTDGLTNFYHTGQVDAKLYALVSAKPETPEQATQYVSNDDKSKTQNFLRNIFAPDSSREVTVDTHMTRASLGLANIGYEIFSSLLEIMKSDITAVITAMAADYDMLPLQVQAVIWTGYKIANNSKL